MTLKIIPFTLGPMDNNTFLVGDESAGKAVIIDPSFESELVVEKAAELGWEIQGLWLTHGHFDHFAGVSIAYRYDPPLTVGLHPDDMKFYLAQGGARFYGFSFEKGPEPGLLFSHGQKLSIGNETIEVRHAPGHTPGHVIFYAPGSNAAFCGDVIFYRSIGRTDLIGGSFDQLIESIQNQVLTLPDKTLLLTGHGPDTIVEEERRFNPFL